MSLCWEAAPSPGVARGASWRPSRRTVREPVNRVQRCVHSNVRTFEPSARSTVRTVWTARQSSAPI